MEEMAESLASKPFNNDLIDVAASSDKNDFYTEESARDSVSLAFRKISPGQNRG